MSAVAMGRSMNGCEKLKLTALGEVQRAAIRARHGWLLRLHSHCSAWVKVVLAIEHHPITCRQTVVDGNETAVLRSDDDPLRLNRRVRPQPPGKSALLVVLDNAFGDNHRATQYGLEPMGVYEFAGSECPIS